MPIEIPQRDTADADKTVLKGIWNILRFIQVAIENCDVKYLDNINTIFDYIMAVFMRTPDKNSKRCIALIFKETVIQLT